MNNRHHPSPALAEAIHVGRQEILERRCGNLINLRLAMMNMALWRRGRDMRSWTYEEAFRGYRGPRLP